MSTSTDRTQPELADELNRVKDAVGDAIKATDSVMHTSETALSKGLGFASVMASSAEAGVDVTIYLLKTHTIGRRLGLFWLLLSSACRVLAKGQTRLRVAAPKPPAPSGV